MKKLILVIALLLVAVRADSQVGDLWYSNPFSCYITSTATTLTEITGCAVLTSGQRRYITDVVWGASVISTASNHFKLQYGTGAACVTGTTTIFEDMSVAQEGSAVTFAVPIQTSVNAALCFIHGATGTKAVLVQGYIQ